MDVVVNQALLRSTKKVGVMVPVDESGKVVCPVCEERRKKNAAAVRKYRARKREEQ